MREIHEISIHCAATPRSWMADRPIAEKVTEIRRWHVDERGWQDIGYHFLIDRDGSVAAGRPLEKIPAAVRGHNTGMIAICLVGGQSSEADEKFEDNFTAAQNTALRAMIADMRAKFPSIEKVTGHNRYAAKACPGFRVDEWYHGKAPKPKAETVAGSATFKAALLGLIANGAVMGTVATSFEHLHDGVQYALIGLCGLIIVTTLIILRSRIRHWARGVR